MDVEKPDWLEQMEGILETLNEGVMISDDCHQILFVNERFLEMIGIGAEGVVGRTPNHFYFGEDYELLARHIAQGEKAGHDRFEFFVPQRGGGRLPVIVSARGLEDPDGRQFAVTTFTNISEQKEAEARLQAANQQLAQRQQEIDEELELAARVQQSLTPRALQWGRVAVEAFYLPVRTIGGDFGLVHPDGDRSLNLLVCDVSGHGISSALVANRIYSETVSLLERGAALGVLVREMNDFVLHHLGAAVFYFSLAAVRLDAEARRMEFAGAGHPPVMVARRNGAVELLRSRSLILGVLPDAAGPDAVQEVALSPGDRVVLYTDGCTESFNPQRVMLGIEGLQKIVRAAAMRPLPEMKEYILAQIASWRAGPPADDMSLVLVEIKE